MNLIVVLRCFIRCFFKNPDPEFIQFLIDKGIDVQHQMHNGYRAIEVLKNNEKCDVDKLKKY